MLYNTLYVPTWLIRYFDNLINPNENVNNNNNNLFFPFAYIVRVI